MAARRLFHLQPCGEGQSSEGLRGSGGTGGTRLSPCHPRLPPRLLLVAQRGGMRWAWRGGCVLVFPLGMVGEKSSLCFVFYFYFNFFFLLVTLLKLSCLCRAGCSSCGDAVGQEDRGEKERWKSWGLAVLGVFDAPFLLCLLCTQHGAEGTGCCSALPSG